MNAQKRQLRVYLGENEPVQDLRGSTEKGDRCIRHKKGMIFARLQEWNYGGKLP